MNHPRLLIAVSMVMSFVGFLYGKGVYFFTDRVLKFDESANLWLALAGGAIYVAAALMSHAVADRIGEKRLANATLLLFLLVNGFAAWQPNVAGVWVAHMGNQISWALFWPVIESYCGAGRTPKQQSRSMGAFNLAWASTGPIGMLAAAPVLAAGNRWLFVATGAAGIVVFFLLIPVAARPKHLDGNHPDRPDPVLTRRYNALLASSRWTMLSAFALTLIVASLMPMLFKDGLKLSESKSILLGSLKDFGRVVIFLLLFLTHRWHGRIDVLLVTALAVPIGFFTVLFAPNPTVAGVGVVTMGLAEGVAYYAAIYYAMVVKNASVDAGGAHESLVGLGFTIGPAAGLLGQYLTTLFDDRVLGNVLGIGPLIVVCGVMGLRSLWRARANPVEGEPDPTV